MGAFFLVCEPDPERRSRLAAALDASLREQGFAAGETVCGGAVHAGFYGKLDGAPAQLHVARDGRFAALCGTTVVDGVSGAGAARALLAAAGAGLPDVGDLPGAFCAVLGGPETVRLVLDPMGVYKVYASTDLRLFSSSFVALARALGGVTPDAQGVYEYVHQEATYGGATVASEIRLADCAGHYELAQTPRFVPRRDPWSPRLLQGGMQVHLERCLTRLRGIYSQLAACFGDGIDTALSGGYDSRLTLALLLEQGLHPSIHVYGHEESADVAVARTVAHGEGLALEHVDKSRMGAGEPARFAAAVRENFLVFDGWPPAGIFDRGADLATRRSRARGGRLMLNGGGGEIFRNFFYLPARRFTPMEVAWSFYSRYAPRWCTAVFDERAYLETLADKIAASVGGGEALSREQVEYVYPAFRCRFWMGRNNSVNTRIGQAMTPFIDRQLVRLAAGVPLRHKEHGRFEAALIRAVSPALARYPSDYGHAFDRDPPMLRILKDHATLLRPPRLRRYTYRVRFRKPVARPEWLQPQMLAQVMDPALPIMSRFFHPARVHDPEAFARVATLEYLFGALGR